MKRVALMFAGQGAQQVGMGKDLYDNSPAAREVFDKADSILGRSITAACFSGPQEQLTESRTCQPAIYVASIACLAALREAVDFEPVAAAGLSLGEFAACTAAGVFDIQTGLPLVARRGELMQTACRESVGAMAAVLNADPELLARICKQSDVDIANFNCPGQTVISGESGKIDQALTALREAGVKKVVKLDVDGAFHSRLMAPAAEEFGRVLAELTFDRPQFPVAQNVVGQTVSDPAEISRNLEQQITGSVRWEDCVAAMNAEKPDLFIELGPGRVLSGFMRRIDRTATTCNVATSEDLAKTVEVLAS